MNRKSKKAIDSLNKYLENIEAISSVKQGNTWKASLKDTINLSIGQNSSISQRLDKLYFTRKEHGTVEGVIGIFTDHIYDESKKEDFKDLIAVAIKHIELNGVYKNPNRKNFLNNFNNSEIISGLVFSILFVFGVGHYFGKIEKDKESMRTEEKLKALEIKNEKLSKENDSLTDIFGTLKKQK